MKKSVKLAIICSVAGICVVLAAVGIIFGVKKAHSKQNAQSKNVVVGFYNISKSQQQVFTNVIEEICETKEIAADFFERPARLFRAARTFLFTLRCRHPRGALLR